LADQPCRPHRSPGATLPLLVSWVAQLRRQRWTGAGSPRPCSSAPRPSPGSCGARGWRGCGRSSPRSRCSAMSGPAPASWCISMSRNSGGSGAWGTASAAIGGAGCGGIGWEYVHVAIAAASRLAYVEVLRDEGGVTTTQFWWRARAWFRRHGLRGRRVLTDNGSGYVSTRFARLCRSLGVRHLRTRPYTPRSNGKPSASSRPSCASGRTAGPTRARATAPRRCPSGCITTIGSAAMAPSTVDHPSVPWWPRTIFWRFTPRSHDPRCLLRSPCR